jgi:hypothetical protein
MTNQTAVSLEARWAAKFGGSVQPLQMASAEGQWTHVQAGGENDPDRLARAVRRRCLAVHGVYMDRGAFVGADGRPVPVALAKAARVITEDTASLSTTPAGINNPNRLIDAIRRRLAA